MVSTNSNNKIKVSIDTKIYNITSLWFGMDEVCDVRDKRILGTTTVLNALSLIFIKGQVLL